MNREKDFSPHVRLVKGLNRFYKRIAVFAISLSLLLGLVSQGFESDRYGLVVDAYAYDDADLYIEEIGDEQPLDDFDDDEVYLPSDPQGPEDLLDDDALTEGSGEPDDTTPPGDGDTTIDHDDDDDDQTGEPVNPAVPDAADGLSISFRGDLYLTPEMLRAAGNAEALLLGDVSVSPASAAIWVSGLGGFTASAQAGESFEIIYYAETSDDNTTAQRTVSIVDDLPEEEPVEEEEILDEEEEEALDPQVTFTIGGDLSIGLAELRSGDLDAILMGGVRAVDEQGENVTHLIAVDAGGLTKDAQAGETFTITYTVEHRDETFTAERTAEVVAPEQSVTFTFDGPLAIGMEELHAETDLAALLLRGVTAVNELGEDLTELITVRDDGGFAAYYEGFAQIAPPGQGGGFFPGLGIGLETIVDPFAGLLGRFMQIAAGEETEPSEETAQAEGPAFAFTTQVTYAVVHPEADDDAEPFVSDPRDLQVSFMGIVATGSPVYVSTFQELEAAISVVNASMTDITVEVILIADIYPTKLLRVGTLSGNSPKREVQINGQGHTIFVPTPDQAAHFEVAHAATLRLADITIMGDLSRSAGGISTTYDGQPHNIPNVYMDAGSRITNVQVSTSWSAPVNLTGRLTMNAGSVIENNVGVNGGGVHIMSGELIMNGGEIKNNEATNGGGVFIADPSMYGMTGHSSTFTMHGGAISNNTASNKGGGVALDGGPRAIFNMQSGLISGNKAESGGGVNVGTGGWEPADGTFTMNGGTISGNTVTNAGGGVRNTGTFTMNSGAVIEKNTAVQGGGVDNSSVINYRGTFTGTFVMNGSAAIQDNESVFNAGQGGGVNNGGTFTMNDGVISGNKKVTSSSSMNVGGGGVANDGSFEMINGQIFDNSSSAQGGAIFNNVGATFTMRDGWIYGNTASYSGGGIHNLAGTVRIEGGTIGGSLPAHANTAGGQGGGVNSIRFINIGNPTFTLVDGAIIGNRAADGGGVNVDGTFTMEAGEISENTATSMGGGVRVGQAAAFTMKSGSISGNFVNNNQHSNRGGGVYIASGGSFTMEKGSSISDNRAPAGGGVGMMGAATFTMKGGEISENTALTHFGGGVALSGTGASFILEYGTIDENTVIGDVGGTNYGGGVALSGPGASFTMKEGSISNNRALDGGGVGIWGASTFIMHTGIIATNYSRNGGGVHIANSATFTMHDGTIIFNEVEQSGGGVYAGNAATFTMHNGEFQGNRGQFLGGGVALNGTGTTFTMVNGKIFVNETTGSGGGVSVVLGARFTMQNGTISDNVAGDGGGVETQGNNGATFRMEGGSILRNRAITRGGGIRPDRNTTTQLVGGEIIGNIAGTNGGGIYANLATVALLEISPNVTFSGNTALAPYWMEDYQDTSLDQSISPAGLSVSALRALHAAPIGTGQIATTTRSDSGDPAKAFTYLTNNYDINFVGDQAGLIAQNAAPDLPFGTHPIGLTSRVIRMADSNDPKAAEMMAAPVALRLSRSSASAGSAPWNVQVRAAGLGGNDTLAEMLVVYSQSGGVQGSMFGSGVPLLTGITENTVELSWAELVATGREIAVQTNPDLLLPGSTVQQEFKAEIVWTTIAQP